MANKEKEEITKLIIAISDKWKETTDGNWKKLGDSRFNEPWFEKTRSKRGDEIAQRIAGFDSSQITQWRNGKKVPQWARDVFAQIGIELGFDIEILSNDSFTSDKWRKDLETYRYYNDEIEEHLKKWGWNVSREFLFYFKKNFMDLYTPNLKLKRSLHDKESMELYNRISFQEDYDEVFETEGNNKYEKQLFHYVRDPYFLNKAAANSPYFYKDSTGKYYEFSDGDYEILSEIESKVHEYIKSLLKEIEEKKYEEEEFFICLNILREAAGINPENFAEMVNDKTNKKIQSMYEIVLERIFDQLDEIEDLKKTVKNNVFQNMKTAITVDDVERLIANNQGNIELQVKGLASILSLTNLQLQYLKQKEKEEKDNARTIKDRENS